MYECENFMLCKQFEPQTQTSRPFWNEMLVNDVSVKPTSISADFERLFEAQ